MRSLFKQIEQRIAIALSDIRKRAPKPVLRIWAFHALCENEAIRQKRFTHPHYTHTLAELKQVIAFCLDRGFQFTALSAFEDTDFHCDAPRIALTFDDGYDNQRWALPILEAFQVPATFFIPSQYVESQQRFWWDVWWSQKSHLHTEQTWIQQEAKLAAELPEKIVQNMLAEWGRAIFEPNEANRPMNREALIQLAKHPLVHIGNHTHSHPVLTHVSPVRLHKEIEEAQAHLVHWCGDKALPMMAYPNGASNAKVQKAAQEAGMKWAFTTRQAVIQDVNEQPLNLPRYSFRSDLDLMQQLRYFTSDFSWQQNR